MLWTGRKVVMGGLFFILPLLLVWDKQKAASPEHLINMLVQMVTTQDLSKDVTCSC